MGTFQKLRKAELGEHDRTSKPDRVLTPIAFVNDKAAEWVRGLRDNLGGALEPRAPASVLAGCVRAKGVENVPRTTDAWDAPLAGLRDTSFERFGGAPGCHFQASHEQSARGQYARKRMRRGLARTPIVTTI